MTHLYEKLRAAYPSMFADTDPYNVGIGDGWYNIVDTLCASMMHHVKYHNDDVKARLQKIEAGTRTREEYTEEQLALMTVPRIVQIKEKFGSLRFYADGIDNKRFEHWIELAEMLSSRTCEVCGGPGTIRTDGWHRCMCDAHEAEYQSTRNR